MAANEAILDEFFIHPDLSPDDNEFPIWRVVAIGRHKFNESDDLLVLTESEHYNREAVPQKVIGFGFDYRELPIYLDLTDEGSGRVNQEIQRMLDGEGDAELLNPFLGRGHVTKGERIKRSAFRT